MIIHLGSDTGVQLSKIVAILDIDGQEPTSDTKSFLQSAKEKGLVRQVTPPPHKSCVITKDKQGCILYLSPITSQTLNSRAAMRFDSSPANS
jgi:hypothetical protein